MRHVVIAHHPAHGTPDHCDTCDTLGRPHGVSYVVEGHGEFCSRRCYEHWAGEPWALLEGVQEARALAEAGNVSAAYIIGCLLALLPGTLVAFVLGALAGAASGVA